MLLKCNLRSKLQPLRDVLAFSPFLPIDKCEKLPRNSLLSANVLQCYDEVIKSFVIRYISVGDSKRF